MTTKTDKMDEPRSLGEVFNALRPGAPCPWCGGELHSRVPSSAWLIDEQESSEHEEESVLWCPGCGSEVHGCPRRGGATNSRMLGTAA